MAEIFVGAAVSLLLEKLVSLAEEEISLFRGFKNDLKMLEGKLEMTRMFLNNALERDIEKDLPVKRWLCSLEDVTYEADNLLDEFNYEIVRRKVEIESQVKQKTYIGFNSFGVSPS
ncbi:putative disease resistance protein RGA1 isoform X2 [Henckelia pumila]|uniref:putative disease resistance protein RGA1 isoform X2 n=1 Tax=Henckelia pumila TaxID=405737 RepID=UPI003C6E33B4